MARQRKLKVDTYGTLSLLMGRRKTSGSLNEIDGDINVALLISNYMTTIDTISTNGNIYINSSTIRKLYLG